MQARSTTLQRGFTLMELVIVIALLGILSALGASIFVDSFTVTRMVDSTQRTAGSSRYALERLARELREVKYSALTTAYTITLTAPAGTLAFTRSSGGVEQVVSVALTGSDLTLSYGTPQVLAKNVSAFTASYLKIDGTTATAGTNVRFVVLALTVTDPVSGQASSERLRVALRSG
ncbi:MAG TPA: prepilin-type N-terminal cleavage/methylation domain-containing protein [Ramlibacter sp.]|nr:prepilin-type N-terminal cleavage/methylation domain-containing protein [Ramlibacter sp.]